jgi:hypothetical protein
MSSRSLGGEQPQTLPVVSLVELRTALQRQYRGFKWVRAGLLGAEVLNALQRHGALVLELPPDEAETLKEALGASDLLFGGSARPDTQLVGGKSLVEYRSGADAPIVPAEVAPSAELAHACLVAAGRDILGALNGTYPGKSDAVNGGIDEHQALLEPESAPRRRDRRRAVAAAAAAGEPSGSPSVLTWLSYDAGAQAAPHTDRGLLTLVFAEQAGLEICMRSSGAWIAPPVGPNAVLVFAGECLQLATGNVVRACVHRVAPGRVPRRSLVMRLRARPDAELPLVYGPYWRCATVREFNARFAATHSSVNEPVRVSPPSQAAASRVPVRASARRGVVSLMETLLTLPELAAAIAHALGDDVKALARAELVCRALRDAVAPHWRRICLACEPAPRPEHLTRYAELELPSCIVATDARQWCFLLGRMAHIGKHMSECITVKVIEDSMEVHFRVLPGTKCGKIFDAYCMKKQRHRRQLMFLWNGQRAPWEQTLRELEMEDGDAFDCRDEQLGD